MDGIVLICDQVENRNNVDITSTNLEFTSPRYLSAFSDAATQITPRFYIYNSPEEFINNINKHKNDIVFTSIWSGELSRNRKSLLPAVCEAYNIKYVGADAYVQILSQDKALSKIHAKQYNIHSAKGILINNSKQLSLLEEFNYPAVIKPNFEGSSIGISDSNLVYNPSDALKLVTFLLPLYHDILVEEFIQGIEVAICCAGTHDSIELCEVVALEIDGSLELNDRIWGYESKKCSKAQVSRKIITNEVSEEIISSVKKAFLGLGKVDYMRIDGKIYNNTFYLIEYTPDCSLHPDCFMVKAFEYNNYSYSEMLKKFIQIAYINLQGNQFPKNLA